MTPPLHGVQSQLGLRYSERELKTTQPGDEWRFSGS